MNEIVWLNIPLIEWIGYAASTLVLISLSLSSLVKLRIFNLFGAAIFSFYGFYIGALPVGIMNLIIVFFNIYYLRFLLFKKELFDVVEVNADDGFLAKFLDYHRKDIKRFFVDFTLPVGDGAQVLLALRDAKVAGIFIVAKQQEGMVEILLDYVTAEYRDYKMGRFLLQKYQERYSINGVEKILCRTNNKQHEAYLMKMGFKEIEQGKYLLQLKC